jgi:hypothetical protein
MWNIRDFGRGLNYHHLTQNQNQEKINNDKLIGKFGVGLKDALATLYRNNIEIYISLEYGIRRLNIAQKSGFEDIFTLHADIEEATDPTMVGTDSSLSGCSDEDIFKAKGLFLEFENASILENTVYGMFVNQKGYEPVFLPEKYIIAISKKYWKKNLYSFSLRHERLKINSNLFLK